MLVVYVSGPYTAPTAEEVELNVMAAIDAANALLDLGCNVQVPHLSHYLHRRKPRDYENWMRLDLDLLTLADVVLRLPGVSPGADREIARAVQLEKPVYYSVAALKRGEGIR